MRTETGSECGKSGCGDTGSRVPVGTVLGKPQGVGPSAGSQPGVILSPPAQDRGDPPPASATCIRDESRCPEAIWPHWAQACPAQRDCPSGPSTSTWAVARARGGSWPLHADLASQNPHSHGPPQLGGGDPAGGMCPGHGLGSSFPVSAQGGECEEPPPALPRDASPLPPTWDGTGSLPLPAPPPASTPWAVFLAWGGGLVRLGQSPALCATETPEGFGELGLQALVAVGMRGH